MTTGLQVLEGGFTGRPVAQTYSADAVHFDGTNDFLVRGAGLTGATDVKTVTLTYWLRKQGSDGASERIISGLDTLGGGAANLSFRSSKLTTDTINLVAENAAGTQILNIQATADVFDVADGWGHFIASVDLSDTGKRHLFVSGVSDLTVNTYTNDTIDMTLADWSIGADADGTSKLQADVADLMLWPAYIDLSVTANLRLFISAAGKPVDPAGAISALGTPLVRQSGPTADWHTNKGGGGGFTENGALTDASTSPSD